jgi:hypothetical protein
MCCHTQRISWRDSPGVPSHESRSLENQPHTTNECGEWCNTLTKGWKPKAHPAAGQGTPKQAAPFGADQQSCWVLVGCGIDQHYCELAMLEPGVPAVPSHRRGRSVNPKGAPPLPYRSLSSSMDAGVPCPLADVCPCEAALCAAAAPAACPGGAPTRGFAAPAPATCCCEGAALGAPAGGGRELLELSTSAGKETPPSLWQAA